MPSLKTLSYPSPSSQLHTQKNVSFSVYLIHYKKKHQELYSTSILLQLFVFLDVRFQITTSVKVYAREVQTKSYFSPKFINS